jgi:hypothetical protein
MQTHSMIFVTIGDLISPPSFPFARQVKGKLARPLPNEKICPFSAARKSRAVKPRWWAVVSLASLAA